MCAMIAAVACVGEAETRRGRRKTPRARKRRKFLGRLGSQGPVALDMTAGDGLGWRARNLNQSVALWVVYGASRTQGVKGGGQFGWQSAGYSLSWKGNRKTPTCRRDVRMCVCMYVCM